MRLRRWHGTPFVSDQICIHERRLERRINPRDQMRCKRAEFYISPLGARSVRDAPELIDISYYTKEEKERSFSAPFLLYTPSHNVDRSRSRGNGEVSFSLCYSYTLIELRQ